MYHIRRMIDPHPPNKTLDKGNRIVYIWLAPNIVGVFNGEGPPVPIPNTEVKLTSADNTCLETDREDRSMPTSKGLAQVRPFAFASLAQQVEHAAVNRRVVGSNPTGGAIQRYCRHDIVTAILLNGEDDLDR